MKKQYHVVAGVVYHEGRILCVKKGKTKYDYTSWKYEFPGGKIEPGETPQAALQRELQEELQIHVAVQDYITTVEHSYPDFSIKMAVYKCTIEVPHVVLGEHVAFHWLSLDQVQSLAWCRADEIICDYLVNHPFSPK